MRVSGAVNDNVIRHPSAALARGTLISIIAISGYYNLCEVSGSESKRARGRTPKCGAHDKGEICEIYDRV